MKNEEKKEWKMEKKSRFPKIFFKFLEEKEKKRKEKEKGGKKGEVSWKTKSISGNMSHDVAQLSIPRSQLWSWW